MTTDKQKIIKKVIQVMQYFPNLDAQYDEKNNTLYVENRKYFFNDEDEIMKILDYKTGKFSFPVEHE